MTRGWRGFARLAPLALASVVGSAPVAAAPRLVATPTGVRWQGAALNGRVAAAPAPVAAWWSAARDTGLAGSALLASLADSLAARGDTAHADSLLAAPRLARSIWAWEGLRRRVAWARAKRDPARAARLLDAADRRGWPASEEAAWRAVRAPLHLALRDTLAGEVLARSVLEEYVTSAPASGLALALLDTLAKRRREPFAPRLERRAAAAEWANGARARALARLGKLMRSAPANERGADALQRVQWLREWRRPLAAIAASDTALRWTRGTPEFDQVRLERARSFRAAGRSDSALALYQRLGRTATDAGLRTISWWECAREAQDESRWSLAARAFRQADSVSRAASTNASLVRSAVALAGLVDWMAGHESHAIRAWRASPERRARFWLGVALRQRGAVEGDSILREEFALRPGYDHWSVAARDTLRLPGWRAPVQLPVADTLEPEFVAAIAALSGPLALPEVAARLVAARDRVDARLPRGPQRAIAASSWRELSVAAYAAGDLANATRAADRALTAERTENLLWSWTPWAYPPAFERELSLAADAAGVERALLWALVRQESRFDPRAVSRSNALGLCQLLPGTGRDMARELRERLPETSLLFEPDRSLRYGARYLRKLLDRFDGVIPVALTAYNAGPGKVRADWRAILARGGWALYCEMAANADTQDYVRRILGFRQAYRELRPAAAPRP